MSGVEDFSGHSQNVFDTYCQNFPQEILQGDELYLDTICTHIADFTNTVFGLMNDHHPVLNSDIGDRIYGTHGTYDGKTDTTYHKFQGLCRNRKGEPMCERMYEFQKFQKFLIPQITHIVTEFGTLGPLKINNLQLKPGVTPSTTIFGVQPSEYLEWEKTLSGVDMVFKLRKKVIKKIKDNAFVSQPWLNMMVRNIDTVKKLRYIDLQVCKNFRNPPNKENRLHLNVYNAFHPVVISIEQAVETMNADREADGLPPLNITHGTDYRIPHGPIDT